MADTNKMSFADKRLVQSRAGFSLGDLIKQFRARGSKEAEGTTDVSDKGLQKQQLKTLLNTSVAKAAAGAFGDDPNPVVQETSIGSMRLSDLFNMVQGGFSTFKDFVMSEADKIRAQGEAGKEQVRESLVPTNPGR